MEIFYLLVFILIFLLLLLLILLQIYGRLDSEKKTSSYINNQNVQNNQTKKIDIFKNESYQFKLGIDDICSIYTFDTETNFISDIENLYPSLHSIAAPRDNNTFIENSYFISCLPECDATLKFPDCIDKVEGSKILEKRKNNNINICRKINIENQLNKCLDSDRVEAQVINRICGKDFCYDNLGNKIKRGESFIEAINCTQYPKCDGDIFSISFSFSNNFKYGLSVDSENKIQLSPLNSLKENQRFRITRYKYNNKWIPDNKGGIGEIIYRKTNSYLSINSNGKLILVSISNSEIEDRLKWMFINPTNITPPLDTVNKQRCNFTTSYYNVAEINKDMNVFVNENQVNNYKLLNFDDEENKIIVFSPSDENFIKKGKNAYVSADFYGANTNPSINNKSETILLQKVLNSVLNKDDFYYKNPVINGKTFCRIPSCPVKKYRVLNSGTISDNFREPIYPDSELNDITFLDGSLILNVEDANNNRIFFDFSYFIQKDTFDSYKNYNTRSPYPLLNDKNLYLGTDQLNTKLIQITNNISNSSNYKSYAEIIGLEQSGINIGQCPAQLGFIPDKEFLNLIKEDFKSSDDIVKVLYKLSTSNSYEFGTNVDYIKTLQVKDFNYLAFKPSDVVSEYTITQNEISKLNLQKCLNRNNLTSPNINNIILGRFIPYRNFTVNYKNYKTTFPKTYRCEEIDDLDINNFRTYVNFNQISLIPYGGERKYLSNNDPITFNQLSLF